MSLNFQSRFRCPPNLLAILATIRAATFLDIYELHNDKELLFRSRKTIDKAWAISKINGSLHEASLVYKRIEALRHWSLRLCGKVNKAYSDWADWS